MGGVHLCSCVVVVVVLGVGLGKALAVPPVKAAYWYYGSASDMPASRINTSSLTHVLYAFADLDSSSFSVLPPLHDATLHTFSATLRSSNPSLKTLLSIGGGGSNASLFSAMASSPSSRASFIQSAISLARRNQFDGLDLDWEFPQSDSDMANLGLLFSEWRTAVVAENPSAPLLLTAAVKFNVTVLYGGAGTYPVQSITNNLDWINIMCFDYHGSWEAQTGEHTALYDANPAQTITTDYGIRQWLASGVPPVRAVLGLAMYGRTWYLKDASHNGVGAPAISAGPNSGVYTYDEITEFIRTGKAVCRTDAVTKSAYCYRRTSDGTLWAGYDDKRTIAIKVHYLKAKQLRGYFFWSLASDKNGDLSNQASITLQEHKC